MSSSQLTRATLVIACLISMAGCGGGEGRIETAEARRLHALAATAADYTEVMQRLYVSYYGRPADPKGLAFWAGYLADNGAPSDAGAFFHAYNTSEHVRLAVDNFGKSDESTALYGTDPGAIVDAIYQNLFNRAPDSGGRAFYIEGLQKQWVTPAQLAMSIANGAQGTDAEAIQAKVAVATQFTERLNPLGMEASYSGLDANQQVRQALRAVGAQSNLTDATASLVASIGNVVSPQGSYALVAPDDRQVSRQVGSLLVEAFDRVTLTPVENGTNLYFTVTNTGTAPRTLQFPSMQALQAARPSWVTHLFKFFGNGQDSSSFTLAPGASTQLEFFLSKDTGATAVTQGSLPFTFRSVEDALQATVDVQLSAHSDNRGLKRTTTARLAGVVKGADGQPLPGTTLTVGLWNENLVYTTTTDAQGAYSVDVLALDDLQTLLGPRPLPYRSLEYFITAEAAGHEMAYRDGLKPQRGRVSVADLSLKPRLAAPSYRLVGELATNGLLAYWRVKFLGDDRVVGVQGQHPPVDPGPGHVVASDLAGQELWRVATDQQCWGVDVTQDGRYVAAGCEDGFAYVINRDGQLLHRLNLGNRRVPDTQLTSVASVQFSPDGTKLLVDGGGALRGVTLVDVVSGAVIWKSAEHPENWSDGKDPGDAYFARWSPDGQRIVVGGSGLLSLHTTDGRIVWQRQMGESPLWLEIDAACNVYAAGKSRMLLAYAADGSLRWKYRIAHTTNKGNPGISATGDLVVLPTFNGVLQAFDASGKVAWQRMLPEREVLSPSGVMEGFVFGPGHEGVALSTDAERIAVSTRGWETLVYNRQGTLLWSHQASQRSSFLGPDPALHGNYTGGTSIAITPDGRHIAVGYADSVIRIFRAD